VVGAEKGGGSAEGATLTGMYEVNGTPSSRSDPAARASPRLGAQVPEGGHSQEDRAESRPVLRVLGVGRRGCRRCCCGPISLCSAAAWFRGGRRSGASRALVNLSRFQHTRAENRPPSKQATIRPYAGRGPFEAEMELSTYSSTTVQPRSAATAAVLPLPVDGQVLASGVEGDTAVQGSGGRHGQLLHGTELSGVPVQGVSPGDRARSDQRRGAASRGAPSLRSWA